MPHSPSESDWRTFRHVQEHALERFCERVLTDVRAALELASKSYHERYVTIFRLLKERDRELAAAFDDPRRSHMLDQLVIMHRHGLVEPDELAQFSSETQASVEFRVKPIGE